MEDWLSINQIIHMGEFLEWRCMVMVVIYFRPIGSGIVNLLTGILKTLWQKMLLLLIIYYKDRAGSATVQRPDLEFGANSPHQMLMTGLRGITLIISQVLIMVLPVTDRKSTRLNSSHA